MHAIESPDAAERFIKAHVCAVCGKRLSVAWGGKWGIASYVIRCSADPRHEGTEHESGGVMTQAVEKWEPKTGLAVLEKQYGAIMASERETEVHKLGVLLEKGFDPALHLMVYQGRLAVKIEGMYWWRDGNKRFRRMKSHPIPPALKAAYGCKEDEIGVITEIFLQGETEPCCEGFGKASMRPYTYKKNESPYDHPDRKRNPLDAEHTYRMAEKRSEGQAIKKFRPLGIEVETPEEMSEVVESTGAVVLDAPGAPVQVAEPPAKPAAPAKPVPTAAGTPPVSDETSEAPKVGPVGAVGTWTDFWTAAKRLKIPETSLGSSIKGLSLEEAVVVLTKLAAGSGPVATAQINN